MSDLVGKPRRPVFSERGSNIVNPDQVPFVIMFPAKGHKANVGLSTKAIFPLGRIPVVYKKEPYKPSTSFHQFEHHKVVKLRRQEGHQDCGPRTYCKRAQSHNPPYQRRISGKGKHYANTPMKYTAIFHGCKNDNFQMKNSDIFSFFCSKHRLWVNVRTGSVRRLERVPTIYVLEQK